jgi:hypothetical protein
VSTAVPHLVRVEKGEASPEELAAVTALLLARASAPGDAGHGPVHRGRGKAVWRRLERSAGFHSPRSWRH